MFFNEYSPLGFATPSPFPLSPTHSLSPGTQTMKNFSPPAQKHPRTEH